MTFLHTLFLYLVFFIGSLLGQAAELPVPNSGPFPDWGSEAFSPLYEEGIFLFNETEVQDILHTIGPVLPIPAPESHSVSEDAGRKRIAEETTIVTRSKRTKRIQSTPSADDSAREELLTREERRERNRMSAAKSRQKKTDLITDLKKKLKERTEENERLKEKIRRLEKSLSPNTPSAVLHGEGIPIRDQRALGMTDIDSLSKKSAYKS